jgi:hypothetical protein
MRALAGEAIARYVERTGLERNLIAPLFYTCWMYWALREAPRFARADAGQGMYMRLLRQCIDEQVAIW